MKTPLPPYVTDPAASRADFTIENANSCGQGYCPAHAGHPLHAATLAAGYTYSHSTPVVYPDGRRCSHTYKARPGARAEHNVSFTHMDSLLSWETSVSCASGRKHTGNGAHALTKHLSGKAKRYRLAIAQGVRL